MYDLVSSLTEFYANIAEALWNILYYFSLPEVLINDIIPYLFYPFTFLGTAAFPLFAVLIFALQISLCFLAKRKATKLIPVFIIILFFLCALAHIGIGDNAATGDIYRLYTFFGSIGLILSWGAYLIVKAIRGSGKKTPAESLTDGTAAENKA